MGPLCSPTTSQAPQHYTVPPHSKSDSLFMQLFGWLRSLMPLFDRPCEWIRSLRSLRSLTGLQITAQAQLLRHAVYDVSLVHVICF